MEFEWDPLKAVVNWRKHGILFESAVLIFDDPFALRVDDERHSSQTEARYWQIGESSGRIFVVVFTERGSGARKRCRIISARIANKKERLLYELHKRISI